MLSAQNGVSSRSSSSQTTVALVGNYVASRCCGATCGVGRRWKSDTAVDRTDGISCRESIDAAYVTAAQYAGFMERGKSGETLPTFTGNATTDCEQ